jgi:hypothetical protein
MAIHPSHDPDEALADQIEGRIFLRDSIKKLLAQIAHFELC